MITVQSKVGVSLRNRQHESNVVDYIFDGDRMLGVAERRAGGNASMFVAVSESIEDEIRYALDARDGGSFDRIVRLAPRDPRRQV